MLKEGANWVRNLPEYQSIMNDDVKQELGGRSPFQIYFSRDPESEGDDVIKRPKVWPTISKKDISDMGTRRKLLTKAAYDASSKCAKAMVNQALKRFPLPIYKMNEKIIVRYPFGTAKKSKSKRRFSIIGRVIGRNIPLSKYRVEYKNPECIEAYWLLVSDITSKTLSK